MKYNLIPTARKLYQTYKVQILKGAALALVLSTGCYLSYKAGQGSRILSAERPLMSDSGAGDMGPEGETLRGEPYFVFPPYASYSQATPANAGLMSPGILNLAYLYEDGADTANVTDSYAGRLYSQLSEMDARWASGLYELYNYTPKRLADQTGQPVQSVTGEQGIIPEFKHVNIHFVNGDGQPTSHTSNSRDIIAMGNTLYYHGILEDMEQLREFSDNMWKDSHHYSVQMGEIYYCDGSCTEASGTPAEGMDQPDVSDGNADQPDAPGGDAGKPDETGGGTVKPDETGGDAVIPSAAVKDSEMQPAPDQGTGIRQTDPGAVAGPGIESGPGAENGPGTEDGPGTGSESQKASDMPVQPTGSRCPGHMDLTITVVVKGTEEDNGLFKTDTDVLPVPGRSKWQGWSGGDVEGVRTLLTQDWYEEYGLNSTDLLMRNPLTSEEIDIYMKMVPENTSQMKKDFVKYALTSVGKIPYYWGGKPVAPGYTGNDFGAVVPPDEDGRFLKGLDCSGWINWLYWSVSGRGLGAESTGTLISSGTAITKEQLVPGDICIRTGPQAHVVVFLGWTGNGKMLCIQETSGNINNVEVGITTGDWQSYRRIIE